MTISKMNSIAKLLDVEEKEEFTISRDNEKIKVFISLDGLYIVQSDNNKVLDDGRLLNKILLGLYDIEKEPWQPKDEEEYFYPAIFNKTIKNAFWKGSTDDYALKLLDMIYRNKEKAQEHFVEDYKKLTGKELEKYYADMNNVNVIDYKKKFEALLRMINRNCYGLNTDMIPAKYLNRVAREASRLENYANYYGESLEEKERAEK